MACPLCGESEARSSWVSPASYEEAAFPYVSCVACGTQYCDPMPSADTLSGMYGAAYTDVLKEGESTSEEVRDIAWILRWLERTGKPRRFVDYGCGAGQVLTAVRAAGWQVGGVEMDSMVARNTSATVGAVVVTPSDPALHETLGDADVLHLADVLEHLPAPGSGLEAALRLLRPGGLLLVQGPLESNASLFTWLLQLNARRRRQPSAGPPPYHLLLATMRGQRALFSQFPLETLEFSLSEVDWPAPSRIAAADLRDPRLVGLFAARRLSKAVSRLRPSKLGNRFLFAGRLTAALPHG